jgi:dipeptidyl aminopeptidase/acylaminoacyl peptidase
LNANDGNQVAINPMTGSQRILRSPVDLYKYMVPCSLGMYNPPVWGPTLRYGIYAQNSNDDYEPGFPYAEHIMWDNQGKTIVGGINTLNECRPTVWSPNGKAFVVAANQDPDHYDQFELYQLDLSGQESKLTSFSKQYEQTDITRYAWSPEGEKIAFSLNAGPGTFNGEHLTILDIPSGDVTEFCLSSSFMPGVVNTPFYAPIWSPDGNAIVIEILGEGERTTQVVLLDLEPATSSVIAENMAPVGWLKGK